MRSKERQARRDAYRDYCRERIPEDISNAQNVFTPYELCYDIIRKLDSKTRNLAKKRFLVLNLEFAEVLIHDFGVDCGNIEFWTDCDEKRKFCQLMYKGVLHKKIELNKEGIIEMTKEAKEMKNIDKFDVVIGNPPYQAPTKKLNIKNGSKGGRNTIWQHFIPLSFSLCKKNGFICLVHPARWRKPEDKTGEILKTKNIRYLEMHSKYDGKKTFGAITNYDWYVLQNNNLVGQSTIRDYNGNFSRIDIWKLPLIPHFNFKIIDKLLAEEKEETCPILYSRSAYGNDKSWMSREKSPEFKYPCVASTTKNKVKFLYSKVNTNGFFGISKVIFGDNGGDTGIYNSIVDIDGKFGITDHGLAIKIKSKSEGEKIKTALESEKFKELIHSCQYGGFQIEWRMFKYFRKDFWKEFI